jgi:hypothetical protein
LDITAYGGIKKVEREDLDLSAFFDGDIEHGPDGQPQPQLRGCHSDLRPASAGSGGKTASATATSADPAAGLAAATPKAFGGFDPSNRGWARFGFLRCLLAISPPKKSLAKLVPRISPTHQLL